MRKKSASDTYNRIYAAVKRIPKGRVATYGQIAELAQASGPRQVGYALFSLKDKKVPWHRVINAKGEVSPRSGSDYDELQRVLLEAEGVAFDARGRVVLARYRWQPRPKRARSTSARGR